jgi:hypothetical protein
MFARHRDLLRRLPPCGARATRVTTPTSVAPPVFTRRSPCCNGRRVARTIEDDWLEGWDPTPAIVSVWAEPDGRAQVWRRVDGRLVRDDVRFRPWLVLDRLDDLAWLGPRLGRDGDPRAEVTYRELTGPGALRYLVRAADLTALTAAILRGASRRLGHAVGHLRDLGEDAALALRARRAVPGGERPHVLPRPRLRSARAGCSSISRPPASTRRAIGSS